MQGASWFWNWLSFFRWYFNERSYPFLHYKIQFVQRTTDQTKLLKLFRKNKIRELFFYISKYGKVNGKKSKTKQDDPSVSLHAWCTSSQTHARRPGAREQKHLLSLACIAAAFLAAFCFACLSTLRLPLHSQALLTRFPRRPSLSSRTNEKTDQEEEEEVNAREGGGSASGRLRRRGEVLPSSVLCVLRVIHGEAATPTAPAPARRRRHCSVRYRFCSSFGRSVILPAGTLILARRGEISASLVWGARSAGPVVLRAQRDLKIPT
jgi:hypothetical protein